MLKALVRWLWPPETPRTQKEAPSPYITRDELDRELRKFEERTEFEFGEWFDKFSALHARAEKRVNRDKHNRADIAPPSDGPMQRVSVLNFRKPWSV